MSHDYWPLFSHSVITWYWFESNLRLSNSPVYYIVKQNKFSLSKSLVHPLVQSFFIDNTIHIYSYYSCYSCYSSILESKQRFCWLYRVSHGFRLTKPDDNFGSVLTSFEASCIFGDNWAGAVLEIGSSLKPNHHREI